MRVKKKKKETLSFFPPIVSSLFDFEPFFFGKNLLI